MSFRSEKKHLNTIHLSVAVICTLMTIGCGSSQVPVYPVSGTVLFENGSPVRTGTVELESRDHRVTATGTIRDDGSFVLGTYTSDDGACPGEHGVIVVQLIINDGTISHSKDHGHPVDPMYASYTTSPLTATVKEQDDNILKLTVTARDKTQ